MTSLRTAAGMAAATLACLATVACSPSTPGPTNTTSPTGGAATSAEPTATDTATPESSPSPSEQVPTRDELVNAAVKLAQDNGVPADRARTAAECVANRGYDKWSDQTLIALGKGDPGGVAAGEREDVTKAIAECARQAMLGN